jgi:aryl-phospho-beta-D-glucosidase BglC (GH1 family)
MTFFCNFAEKNYRGAINAFITHLFSLQMCLSNGEKRHFRSVFYATINHLRVSSMKKITSFITVLLFAVLFLGSACVPSNSKNNESAEFLPMLRVENGRVLNEYNEKVLLQGTNAGGLLVTERWMTLVGGNATVGDNIPMHNTFLERFGVEKTQQLWQHYRENFWTEQDFQHIAQMGMNVIRLPFMHLTVDPYFNQVPQLPGERFNFTILEQFVADAARHGLYTILDLHGTYGSHNGQDHSGLTINVPQGANVMDYVTFWNPYCPIGTENRRKTTELWVATAQHFYGNPNVAGFYLLNEPGEKGTLTVARHWNYFNELYEAIRTVNNRHIIIFNPCWGGGDIPHPTNNPYGFNWDTNVIYSFHHYTHYNNATNYELHIENMLWRVNEVEERNFGVPLMMGEFTVLHGGRQGWESTLKLFQERGWHWTSWTYKVQMSNPNWGPATVWGIFNSRLVQEYGTEEALVNPQTDSFEDIIRKWSRTRTDNEHTFKFAFSDGTTLFDLMQNVINE